MPLRALTTQVAVLAALLLATPAWSDEQGLRTLHEQDRLVSSVGYRLAVANGKFCGRGQPLLGFSIHDLAQYPAAERGDARSIFGFGDRPLVLAVAASSPAAAAGLREGDELLAIDKEMISAELPRKTSYARTQALLERLERAAADEHLLLEIRRREQRTTIEIVLDRGCPTHFFVDPDDSLQSKADGVYVQINSGMIEFAGDEDQVAALLAHELAHNILKHRVRLNAAGIRRGLLGQVGRSARLIRQTEDEADRLSVYLLDNAGYPAGAVVAFWTRYRSAHPPSLLASPTHADPADRIALVRTEIEYMNAMKASGGVVRPRFMDEGALPRLR
ncbi:hypothetical protein DMC47_11345 [Nostoc sp. 3335mG]|nr:hypothetical protein DMC47_11345 [Nostoc sp. 3335mG]